MKAILRRSVSQKTDKIGIADLEIDLIKHKVMRGSQNIDLTSQEFTLLSFLAEHPGQVDFVASGWFGKF